MPSSPPSHFYVLVCSRRCFSFPPPSKYPHWFKWRMSFLEILCRPTASTTRNLGLAPKRRTSLVFQTTKVGGCPCELPQTQLFFISCVTALSNFRRVGTISYPV